MKKATKANLKRCKCGCNQVVQNGKRYVLGHHFKGKKHSRETKEVLRKQRNAYLRKEQDELAPHRLYFPARKKDESLGDYKFRKFEYFLSNYCVHIAGRWAGKCVTLMRWQREILYKLFSTIDENGKRKYKRLYVHLPRKNGKTFMTCLIILYWLAELSFDDPASEILSCASTREQSIKTIFRTAKLMVARSPELYQIIKIGQVPAFMENKLNHAVYEPVAADSLPVLGRNLSLIAFDETHTQPDDQLWQALASSQSMREQPLFVSISTSGSSRASFYYSIYERMKEIQADPSIDESTLVTVFEADEAMDWKSPEAFKKANPALGGSEEAGFRSEKEICEALNQAIQSESAESFKQYYLNLWSSHGQKRLVRLDQWDACQVEEFDIPDPNERRVVGGLDLSSTTDLTGLAIIIEPPAGSKIWVCMTWAWLAGENLVESSRRDKLPYEKWIGKEIVFFEGKPTIQIEAVLQMLAKVKSVFPKFRKLGYDPYLSALLKPVDPYFELLPVAQQYSFLSPALKTLKIKILEKELQHNGDPLLRACVENSRILTDPSGNIRLDKSKSMSRIDPLVALNIAAVVALQEDFRR